MLLLDITHYWLAALQHLVYLAVCFGSVSFSVPSTASYTTVRTPFCSPRRVASYFPCLGFHLPSLPTYVSTTELVAFRWCCIHASGAARGLEAPSYRYAFPPNRNSCDSVHTFPRSAQRKFACMCGPCCMRCLEHVLSRGLPQPCFQNWPCLLEFGPNFFFNLHVGIPTVLRYLLISGLVYQLGPLFGIIIRVFRSYFTPFCT